MLAAVFRGVGKPLAIERVPDPAPADDELLVKVGASGICGTDLHLSQVEGLLPPGSVLGHEFAGEIVAVGRSARGHWRSGQRVAVVPYLVCGTCHACLDGGDVLFCPKVRFTGFGELSGGYAEYVRAGSGEVVALPDSVPDRIGATVEPLCVALQAVEHAEIPAGARVLVLGAGPIGLAVAQWARLRGAGHVALSEPAAGRLALAAAFGATAAIDPSREDVASAFARAAGGPPDVVFECVGAPGMIQKCVDQVRPKGQVVVVGVCMGEDPWRPGSAIQKSLCFRFSIGYRTRHFQLAVEMLAAGRIQSSAMITRELGFDAFPDAFEALKRPGRECKLILEPARRA
jgi:(R,R)-butanediol dehydrogenase/meso-butanediol dehydrogenase/diacetyl reductase